MRKPQRLGLVAAGNLKDSILTHIPALQSQLGPVKSSTLRVASRLVNQLRAGFPVADFSAFEDCSTVLICVPGDKFSHAGEELAGSRHDWKHRVILGTGKWHEPIHCPTLDTCGASVAAVALLPGLERRRYLVEGDSLAIRQARRILIEGNARLIEVAPGTRAFAVAALACAGPLLTPLFKQSTEWLRAAGVDSPEIDVLIRNAVDRSSRGSLKGGRAAQPSSAQLYELVKTLAGADSPLTTRFRRLVSSVSA